MRIFTLIAATFVMLAAYPLLRLANAQKSTSGEQTVTGCLMKGDERNEYSLTGEDGTKYALTGSNLSAHVGHKITVTGMPTKEESSGKTGAKSQKEAAEGEHLKVDKVQMISSTCR